MGMYKDGTPGELFIRMAKEGSTVSGLMDSFATAVSLALQHGVPLKLMCEKFCHTRFEPSGFTGNQEIPIAKSVMDYIFRWLEIRFVSGQQFPLFPQLNAGVGQRYVWHSRPRLWVSLVLATMPVDHSPQRLVRAMWCRDRGPQSAPGLRGLGWRVPCR